MTFVTLLHIILLLFLDILATNNNKVIHKVTGEATLTAVTQQTNNSSLNTEK